MMFMNDELLQEAEQDVAVADTPENKILDDYNSAKEGGDSDGAMDAAADEVERAMLGEAMANMDYFENGEEALKNLCESAEMHTLVEAGKMPKKTFVRLSKSADRFRREHLASLVLAKQANDPLFAQLALNRVKERKLRKAIFDKYRSKAQRVAIISQKKHIKTMKALPPIRFQ